MPHRVLAAVFLPAFACAAARPVPPDFAHDVAPLLNRDCAPCHHRGGPAPFSLLTYRDAARRAAQIASVTHRRYMPPWLPEAGYGDFADARRLTDSEIRLLADWAAAGAPEGPPGAAPPPPVFADGGSSALPTWCSKPQRRSPSPPPDPISSQTFSSPRSSRRRATFGQSKSAPATGSPCTTPTCWWTAPARLTAPRPADRAGLPAWTSPWSAVRSTRTAISCSGSPARRRASSPPASPGGCCPAILWCSTRTCIPPASRRRRGLRSASTSRTRRPRTFRCWCNGSTTARCAFRQARATCRKP